MSLDTLSPCCGNPACRALPPSAEQVAAADMDALVGLLKESVAGWDLIWRLRGLLIQAPAEVVARALYLATTDAINEPEEGPVE